MFEIQIVREANFSKNIFEGIRGYELLAISEFVAEAEDELEVQRFESP